MNTKQLQYAIKLSKTMNFSQVAEQLKISQPALSKQILSLENELGVKLFDRTQNPMCLTPAGKHFVQKAESILYQEDQLLRSMEQFKSGEAGQLNIGITPFRSAYLIPEIVKKVRDRYPSIQIQLHEAGSDTLRAGAIEGKYDFSVVNLPVDDSVLDVVPLEQDRLALIVPNNQVALLSVDENTTEIAFHQCEQLPFVVVGHNQEMRILFDKLCAAVGFHPTIAAEVVSLTTAWAIACAGVGATILPLQFVADKLNRENVRAFEITDVVYTRQSAIVMRKGQHTSEAAAYAIKMLIEKSNFRHVTY